jgi:creatinine amidohydrolase
MEALLDMAHRRAKRLVATGAPVYLGINPVEYHGPHLSLANDAVLSRGLAEGLHARLQADGGESPLLWAGELAVGVEPVKGPGSRPVSPREVRDAAWRACRSLVELGCRAIIPVTFHGAPLHNTAIHAVARRLEAAGIRVYTPASTLFALFLAPDVQRFATAYAPVPAAFRRELQGRVRQDFHAGFLETSLALHYAPETVQDHTSVPPCPRTTPDRVLERMSRLAARLGRTTLAAELAFSAEAVAWYRLEPFPGYTSIPHLASAATGRVLADIIAEECATAATRVLVEGSPCPAPILRWFEPLTLGGALLPTR